MKTLRIGIIGFGFIGKVHAYGYSTLRYYYDLPFDVELYAVAARRTATLDAAARYGFSVRTTDPAALIADPRVDVVDICSPNEAHRDQLLAALAADKHVYCEKPLVADAADLPAVEAALARHTAVGRVVFHNRFFPATIRTREMIEARFLGSPIHFRVAYHHSGSLDPAKPMGWKQEKGAGVLLDLGSHAADLAAWFLGDIEDVMGTTRIVYPQRPDRTGAMADVVADDYAAFLAKTASGATGLVEASKVAAGAQDELAYELYGTRGSIRYNSMDPNVLRVVEAGRDEDAVRCLPTVQRYRDSSFPGPKFAIGWTRGHIHAIRSFLGAVHEGTTGTPSLADGVKNVRVLAAVAESARRRAWVKPGSAA